MAVPEQNTGTSSLSVASWRGANGAQKVGAFPAGNNRLAASALATARIILGQAQTLAPEPTPSSTFAP